MIRTVTLLGLGLLATASCASSSTFKKDSSSGYCFKAEGLSSARCHTEMAACLRSQSTLHDVYPFATIESSCHQRPHGILEVQQVAESTPDQRGP
jgi:hypothetical protein